MISKGGFAALRGGSSRLCCSSDKNGQFLIFSDKDGGQFLLLSGQNLLFRAKKGGQYLLFRGQYLLLSGQFLLFKTHKALFFKGLRTPVNIVSIKRSIYTPILLLLLLLQSELCYLRARGLKELKGKRKNFFLFPIDN